jgi:hypothetical protein
MTTVLQNESANIGIPPHSVSAETLQRFWPVVLQLNRVENIVPGRDLGIYPMMQPGNKKPGCQVNPLSAQQEDTLSCVAHHCP